MIDGPESSDSYEIPYIIGPKGDYLTEKQFNVITKHGCAHCSCDVHPEDAAFTAWTADGQPICSDCLQSMV